MKGIILAGGKGTRLFPLTLVLSKQILPVYDKPIIYYPLSVLMEAAIKEILIISTLEDLPLFRKLLGSGEQLGLTIQYKAQEKPRGIADALILGEEFISGGDACLVLGDNIFYGNSLGYMLGKAANRKEGATVFAYRTENPSAFGVVEIDSYNRAISVEEKPVTPKSPYAVPGIYFYDAKAPQIARTIASSKRGELEITSVNEVYLKEKKLFVEVLPEDTVWFDTGTHDSMLDAANNVRNIQKYCGNMIGCIEELAYRKGFIDLKQFKKLIEPLKNSSYGKYLIKIADSE